MGYSVLQLSEIVNGKMVHASSKLGIADEVAHLLIDSRKIIYAEKSVFIAIKGPRNDGHRYLQDVYDAGVRNFIVEKKAIWQYGSVPMPADANVIQVDSGLKALQQLAKFHRNHFDIPVVGITGSNGKTIVKEWLYQLLKDDVHIVRNPKSFNSQVGVPLSVWQMQPQHQLGLFEAGISEKGEMQSLAEIIQPDIGIFTFLGSAHDEGFHSRKEKLHEKLVLFKQSKLLLYCIDQVDVDEGIQQFLPRHTQLKTVSWSRQNAEADIFFEVDIQQNRTRIDTRKGAQIQSVVVPFTDDASIANACTCFAFLQAIGRVSTSVLKRFEELQAIEMRLELKEAIQGSVLINDSYNADIQALQIAIDFMHQQGGTLGHTLILSDILQTGMKEKELYAEVARILRQKGVNKLIGIGTQIGKYRNLFDSHAMFYQSTSDFITNFKSLDYANQVILLKGARSFEFEKISALLEKKNHETVFEINLNALVQNYNFYKSLLSPGVKVMAMVKAFSYGAGSYEIARVLEFNRVDYLAVAYTDEGVALRKAGIKLPIMVMNPEQSAFDGILNYNLEPEIYNFFIFNQLLSVCKGQEVSIHIELDCGMKRLGFDEAQIDALGKLLQDNPHVRVKSIFAHLVASEDKKHDSFTREQIQKFKSLSDRLMITLPYPVFRHILNSSGIVRFPDAHFDMVRLGIGLYGIDPSASVQKNLTQIGKLKTVISQLRVVKGHETVGYNRKGILHKDSLIATVAIGYADGLSRKLGNGKGYMLVNDKKAPIVGNVCMDMTMLDVTGIDCKEGDSVEVFGKEILVNDIALKSGTIPYEVLTSVSQRVKRVYFWE